MSINLFKHCSFIWIILVSICSCTDSSPKKIEKNLSAIFSTKFDTKANRFQVNNNRDTILFGEEGTAIFIPSNAFITNEGEAPGDSLIIVLKEYYKTGDIVAQQLSTMTADGQLLITGGMINLTAKDKNQELSIRKEKELIIHFPRNGNKEDMSMFKGVQSRDSIIEWAEEKKAKLIIFGNMMGRASMSYDNHGKGGPLLPDSSSFWEWRRKNIIISEQEKRELLNLKPKDVELHYSVDKEGNMHSMYFKESFFPEFESRILKIMAAVPKFNPITIKGIPVDGTGSVWFYASIYQGSDEYTKALDNKYESFSKLNISNLAQADLEYYIFNSQKLGWINCDQFNTDSTEKIDLLIESDNPQNTTIKIVFKDINSILTGHSTSNNQFRFPNIPKGKDITIIALKYENNIPMLSIKEASTNEALINNLVYKEHTFSSMKEALENLNPKEK